MTYGSAEYPSGTATFWIPSTVWVSSPVRTSHMYALSPDAARRYGYTNLEREYLISIHALWMSKKTNLPKGASDIQLPVDDGRLYDEVRNKRRRKSEGPFRVPVPVAAPLLYHTSRLSRTL